MDARDQLTLFVPPPTAERIEHARRLLDPVQAALIAAHVTLCREDELHAIDLATLDARIAAAGAAPISLTFGVPERFHGHGVLLPCIAGEEAFHELRCRILGSGEVRRHAPHLTLAHPRNPRAPGNTDANVSTVPAGLVVTFGEVQHIRQEGALMPWRVIARHALSGESR